MNILLKHRQNESTVIQRLGQTKHYLINSGGNTKYLEGGLTAIRGFFSSVRTSTNRLCLNVNTSSAAFYRAGGLAQLIPDFNPRNATDHGKLGQFLRKLRVKTGYLKDENDRTITKINPISGLAPPPYTVIGVQFDWSGPTGSSELVSKIIFISVGTHPVLR